MIRKLDLLYCTVCLTGLPFVTGCEKYASPSPEEVAQQREVQRLDDQKERAAMVERMKAAAVIEDKKQEAMRNLQKQIDALDVQISAAHAIGKDWRPLEKQQEALEARKYELQRQ